MSNDLCTADDVRFVAYGRTSGIDVSGSDINSAIEDAEDEIYERYGESVIDKFSILSSRTQYEFRKTRNATYLFRRFFVNAPVTAPNKEINRNEIASGSYTVDSNTNKITISSGLAASWNGSYGEVDFIPQKWHLLCKNKAALNVLDGDAAAMNPGEGQTDNPRVSRIAKRISRIEGDLALISAVGSFENINYDIRDREIITQERFNKTA